MCYAQLRKEGIKGWLNNDQYLIIPRCYVGIKNSLPRRGLKKTDCIVQEGQGLALTSQAIFTLFHSLQYLLHKILDILETVEEALANPLAINPFIIMGKKISKPCDTGKRIGEFRIKDTIVAQNVKSLGVCLWRAQRL
ncbi:MAG: hypothetical protein R6V55_03490, partial [Desulfovermiculus sp.]